MREQELELQELLHLGGFVHHQIEKWVSEGPSEDEAVCVNCQNNSYGDKCQRCLEGYFLLDGRCTK